MLHSINLVLPVYITTIVLQKLNDFRVAFVAGSVKGCIAAVGPFIHFGKVWTAWISRSVGIHLLGIHLTWPNQCWTVLFMLSTTRPWTNADFSSEVWTCAFLTLRISLSANRTVNELYELFLASLLRSQCRSIISFVYVCVSVCKCMCVRVCVCVWVFVCVGGY